MQHFSKSYLQSCGTRNLQKHRQTHTELYSLRRLSWECWFHTLKRAVKRETSAGHPSYNNTIKQQRTNYKSLLESLWTEKPSFSWPDTRHQISEADVKAKPNKCARFYGSCDLSSSKGKSILEKEKKKRKICCIHWQSDGNINMENNEAQTRSCACHNLIKLTVLPTSDITCWCNFLSKQTGCWKARRWMNGWGKKIFLPNDQAWFVMKTTIQQQMEFIFRTKSDIDLGQREELRFLSLKRFSNVLFYITDWKGITLLSNLLKLPQHSSIVVRAKNAQNHHTV